jgi:twitching motility protein PilI
MTKKRARKSAHGSRPQPRDAQAAADERVRGGVAVAEQDEMIEETLTVAEQVPDSLAPRRAPQRALLTSFEALIDYERRSLSHVAGVPEQIEAPGLWRGIGFRIGERVFVSSIHEVNEILGMPSAVTPVPATRNWLLGVANVRGNLIALVDLKQFLLEQRTHVSDRTRVLWVKQAGGGVGLLVDEVLGQRNLTDEQRVDAEGESDERLGRFVTENVTLGNTRVGMFSMVELTRAPDFQQTAV